MAPEASFKVALYMRPFYPSDIHIKSANSNSFILHAKHDEHVDQHGIVKRELIREYELPEGISIKMLEFVFTRNGIMIIRAVQAAPIVASGKSSELKVKPTEKKETPEKMECAGSPLKFVGIEIREKKKSESAQEFELAEQTIEEKQKIASYLGLKLDSDGKAIDFEFDIQPSLQSSSLNKMEVEGEAEATHISQSNSTEIIETKSLSETTPYPQSSSTEIMGDIIGSPSRSSTIIMKAMETTQSPPHASSDTMEVTKTARSPQSSPTEVMEPAQSAGSTVPAQSSQSSSTGIMETTETPQLSSTEIMKATKTAHDPSSSSGETMENGGGST